MVAGFDIIFVWVISRFCCMFAFASELSHLLFLVSSFGFFFFLMLCRPRGLSYRGGKPPPRDTIPLNGKLRLPFGYFRVFMSLSQQAKKGVSVLAEVINLDYQGILDSCSTVKITRCI